jgi:phosphatidylglycerophosphate synthase
MSLTPTLHTGTAVRDGGTAFAAAVVLCAVLAAAGSTVAIRGAAAAAGIALVGAGAASVTSRDGRWSGPADRVTLGRTVLIGGCATIGILILAGELPARPWWLLALVVPALALDAVDGFVARRTGTSSAVGARLDMEMDAALLLVLSAVSIRSLGWWVLALGGMRYAFVAAAWFRPQLKAPLAFSQFRRVVAAVQGMTLALALAPILPLAVARTVVALALILLMVSFGRDVITLERGAGSAETAGPGEPVTPKIAPAKAAPVKASPAKAAAPAKAPRPEASRAQAPRPSLADELLRRSVREERIPVRAS